jgi:flagellar hook-associated protein 1 FlgK
MSISGALYNALSSMAAEQAKAQVIANNIANANNAGYVRRVLPTEERVTSFGGQGVAIGVAQRAGDAMLEASVRGTNSDLGYGETMAAGLSGLAQLAGNPSDSRSLSGRLASFQSAMTTLSATPSDSVAQSQALAAAQDLAAGFNGLARALGDGRAAADRQISQDVTTVNNALEELKGVEASLARAVARGDSTAPYEDQRANLLAEISAKVPIRVLNGAPGQLVVTTDQGTSLFDSGRVHRLEFSTSSGFGAADGAGEAVTVDGEVLRSSASGSIAARLQLRDTALPAYGRMLDQMAANLAGGFQAADPTATGTPQLAGLFSRGEAATLDATQSAGMASAIQVNPKVLADPGRLRDGANAASGGRPSDNAVILAGIDSLDANARYNVSGLPASMSLNNAAAQAMGLIQSDAADWSGRAETRGNASVQAAQALANNTGVNTDEELQKLLMVQNAYAASAQVVQVAARMLDTLNSLNS